MAGLKSRFAGKKFPTIAEVFNLIARKSLLKTALSPVAPALSLVLPCSLNFLIMVKKGVLVRLVAKAGREQEVEDMLQKLSQEMYGEDSATAWWTLKFGRLEYGIFDVYPDEESRDIHLNSDVIKSLSEYVGNILAEAPEMEDVDVLADKLPHANGIKDTRGLLLTFKVREGCDQQAEQFLLDAQPMVEKESDTTAWFALKFNNHKRTYGIFDVFPSNKGRLKHLIGRVPRELLKQATSFLSDMPHMDMLQVRAEKLAS
jgi:quinol monooxygenase YgiN